MEGRDAEGVLGEEEAAVAILAGGGGEVVRKSVDSLEGLMYLYVFRENCQQQGELKAWLLFRMRKRRTRQRAVGM